MTKMNPKNLTGLYTFRSDIFPEWFAYTTDSTGRNIPTDNNGQTTNWSPTNNTFNFTDEQEQEIDDNIAKKGYCMFKSTIAVIFSEWQIKK